MRESRSALLCCCPSPRHRLHRLRSALRRNLRLNAAKHEAAIGVAPGPVCLASLESEITSRRSPVIVFKISLRHDGVAVVFRIGSFRQN